jgi:Ala-tRNA(Pro) deacylase
MPEIDQWVAYLDRMQVQYSHSKHPWASTAPETTVAEEMPAHELAKVVLYNGDTGFGFAVARADQFVDLAKVAAIYDLRRIRLANPAELARLFPGCEIGAMPPFGNDFDFPVIVDSEVVDDYITLAFGTYHDIVRMPFRDFQRLAKPIIGSIANSLHRF